jgi:hypothetical protein
LENIFLFMSFLVTSEPDFFHVDATRIWLEYECAKSRLPNDSSTLMMDAPGAIDSGGKKPRTNGR